MATTLSSHPDAQARVKMLSQMLAKHEGGYCSQNGLSSPQDDQQRNKLAGSDSAAVTKH